MRTQVILTTMENGQIVEKPIGSKVTVTGRTNLKALMTTLAEKHFGPKFNVRADDYIFRFVAVNSVGDTLHLKDV